MLFILITRFLPSELIKLPRENAFLVSISILLVMALVVAVVNAHPIKFWRKSAYLMSVLTAVVLFSVTEDPDTEQQQGGVLALIAGMGVVYNIVREGQSGHGRDCWELYRSANWALFDAEFPGVFLPCAYSSAAGAAVWSAELGAREGGGLLMTD